ncbi:UDP-glycosyltransferase 84B2-like protein [Cinnamomum micranthum f. kanehirae]|uniref:Glycosyltransferase n=1 Tax=Cinnamomum micranthum f. kanehirae TaxID=337451 RepID=A0A443NWW1_9MAGN|nr:UDP-glycosyltransferase 84B2-like protein [Cinnamomum micranthum f. kanehirae]
MKEEGRVVNVLLVAFAAQGHMNPMLELAKLLASKGFEITFATTEVARERILKSNITTTPTTLTSHPKHSIHFEFFSDGLPLDFDRRANFDHFFHHLHHDGSRNLSALISTLSTTQNRTFSCIINNPFVPWVANVAHEHKIPCAMLWIQPCTLFSIYYRFYRGLNQFSALEDPNTTVLLPGLPLLTIHDLPSFILPSNPSTSIPKLLSELFENMEKLTWVLGNSFYELEKDAVDSMKGIQPFIPVGPLVPSLVLGKEDDEKDSKFEMWKAEDSCIEWLDKQPPSSVIYISFGSILVLSSKQMENIALGLKESKRPFLWVVRTPDFEDGEGKLSSEFLKETEGQGLVVQWCPQARVLAHDSVACFVTHCGWNSVLESLCCGVPVVAFPQWTDQPTNAKLLADLLEVGVRVRTGGDGVVSAEEVQRCIEEVSRGPRAAEMKKRAADWKEAARAAVADGGSSDRNLQAFVEDVVGRARKGEE